jgi:hypothetical protein
MLTKSFFVYTMLNCVEVSSCMTCLSIGHCKFVIYSIGATFCSPQNYPEQGLATVLDFESGSAGA